MNNVYCHIGDIIPNIALSGYEQKDIRTTWHYFNDSLQHITLLEISNVNHMKREFDIL